MNRRIDISDRIAFQSEAPGSAPVVLSASLLLALGLRLTDPRSS